MIINLGGLNFTYRRLKIFHEVKFTSSMPEFKKFIKLRINYFLKKQGVIFSKVKIFG